MGTPFLAEIKICSFNFAPKGWAQCNGQFLPINQNQALFALMGTTYGGNGQTTFALPDLRGRVPMHTGNGHTLGEKAGEASHTLTLTEMPAHNHFLQANTSVAATNAVNTPAAGSALSQSIGKPSQGAEYPVSIYKTNGTAQTTLSPAILSNTGGSQPHENRQPYLGLNMIVALQGAFPPQN